MLQRTAHQNVPVTTRNRVAPLGQHHARQEVFGALEQNHLALHRLHRQLQAERAQQVTAPGARAEHDLIGVDDAIAGANTRDASALLAETADLAVFAHGHIGQCQQRGLERLHQARVAYVGHARHVDGVLEAGAQYRNGIVGRRDIHGAERPALTLGPCQRLGFVVQIQPVQPGGMHFRVDAGAGEQALTQLWVEILGPMRQSRHGRAVAPGVQRRDDAATGPGRFTTNLALVTDHHLPDLRCQVERSQQADHPAADNHYLLAHLSIQTPEEKTAMHRGIIDPQLPQHCSLPWRLFGLLRRPAWSSWKSPQWSCAISPCGSRLAISVKLSGSRWACRL
ncbi:hypothetical protein D3C76_1008460 [compost metagenome]